MKAFLFIPLLLVSFSLFFTQPAEAASKIAPNIYQCQNLTGITGNVIFLVTAEGVVVVDAGASQQHAAAIQAEIKTVTSQPIRYLILTHSHFDHTFGTAHFPSETLVIGHKNLEPDLQGFMQSGYPYFLSTYIPAQISRLENALQQTPPDDVSARLPLQQSLQAFKDQLAAFRQVRLRVPAITFSDRLDLTLGGQKIQLSFPGTAHSNDNITVYFPDQRVLHTGDLVFNQAFPYIIGGPGGSNTARWIETVGELAEWDAVAVIPGHGPAGSRDILLQQSQLLVDLRQAVQAAINSGQTLAEAQESILLPQYSHYQFRDILTMDIESVYRELTAHNQP